MRITRLAKFLETKYYLKSEAHSLSEVINDVKRALISAYNTYVNSDTAKEPVLQMAASIGEPFSNQLIKQMEKTIANIDMLAESPALLFKQVNSMLGMIQEVKDDPEKTVRNFLHDAIRATKQSEINYRERFKSKFEMSLYRLSSVLEAQAKLLSVFLPKEVPLAGGVVSPERKNLSKEKLLTFTRTTAAKLYGLDSLAVMEKVLQDDDLRNKLTTLINAIDRGHIPVDGPEIMQATKEIMEAFKAKQNNAEQFGEEME